MKRRLTRIFSVIIAAILISCEEVVDIDLNNADPAFVAEAQIFKDSIALVRLSTTFSYFSGDEPSYIENAIIRISNGTLSEELSYWGNGYYRGSLIKGKEGIKYDIEIIHDGITYTGSSTMPMQSEITAVRYSKNNNQNIFNPYGETMYVIDVDFIDEPEKDNYYMIRYILDGEVLEGSYYVLNEKSAVNGTFEISDINPANSDTIRFSEWMFYEGGLVEVQVVSIDKPVYDYFVQLNDILFWKRRFNPPSPYNPVSNISNGALGYFSAWSFDSRKIIL